VTAELRNFAPELTLTGVIAAQVQSEESFRVAGKIRERLASIGDHVKANQVLARLDPDEQKAELQAAQATVHSAEATLRQATLAFERQRNLLATGNTTRREHDQAEAAFKSSQAQLEQARSQLVQATNQLAYTDLHASADGIVVAQMAEAGQVVAQAQPVFGLAQDGDRDAVFNVHEWALANTALDTAITVSLLRDPAIRTAATLHRLVPHQGTGPVILSEAKDLARLPKLLFATGVRSFASLRTTDCAMVPFKANRSERS
jgi:membrane fusion protein, multidrug efflux system